MAHVDLTQIGVCDDVLVAPDGTRVLAIRFWDAWDDSSDQLDYIASKVNNYERFVTSGELAMKFPNAAGMPVRVEVLCAEEPTERVNELFGRARSFLADAKIGFAYRLMPPYVRDALLSDP